MEAASSSPAVVTFPTDTQILITRDFDAPRHLIFRAWTTPDLIKRWWGGERGSVTVAEVDLRVGGTWRYVMTANAGFEVAFHGEYREIVPNERIVATDVFEGVPDKEALTTLTLADMGARTTMHLHVLHASQEDRDAHIASGMEDGMQEAMRALEQVAIALL
ncbi:MAG TPA: SRPBCC family protein [Acidimicrobiales bacterium]|nr:SRPBCC family protein [Acidimicrobiales bacterium]